MHNTETANQQWISVGPEASQLEPIVMAWLDQATPLIWRPVFDCEDFPDIQPEALMQALASCGPCWLIKRSEDLLQLPHGVKGWLLPAAADDTHIACGRWNNRITFMTIKDGRNGEAVTYQTLARLAQPA